MPEKPAKKYITIQEGRGCETQKNINFDGSCVSSCLSGFPERLHWCYIDFH
jgi:hypothetical protein